MLKCTGKIENVGFSKCKAPIKEEMTVALIGNDYFINGLYFGKVIEKTENFFKVKCDNGNKYMKDMIIKINLNFDLLNKKQTK